MTNTTKTTTARQPECYDMTPELALARAEVERNNGRMPLPGDNDSVEASMARIAAGNDGCHNGSTASRRQAAASRWMAARAKHGAMLPTRVVGGYDLLLGSILGSPRVIVRTWDGPLGKAIVHAVVDRFRGRLVGLETLPEAVRAAVIELIDSSVR